ncbi:uncharacterized protein LOC111242279 [Vigna radiata var. radiata]|uniref:Uncharacterized protein LOC111242279 n=1 Tax=Vigna radiata var. radiata TaxID=3916 RepID=A0A3Q0FDS9_VIGRR|nr:uncharacterized protein LOC111242279 [Vigna radiata var. radiata]
MPLDDKQRNRGRGESLVRLACRWRLWARRETTTIVADTATCLCLEPPVSTRLSHRKAVKASLGGDVRSPAIGKRGCLLVSCANRERGEDAATGGGFVGRGVADDTKSDGSCGGDRSTGGILGYGGRRKLVRRWPVEWRCLSLLCPEEKGTWICWRLIAQMGNSMRPLMSLLGLASFGPAVGPIFFSCHHTNAICTYTPCLQTKKGGLDRNVLSAPHFRPYTPTLLGLAIGLCSFSSCHLLHSHSYSQSNSANKKKTLDLASNYYMPPPTLLLHLLDLDQQISSCTSIFGHTPLTDYKARSFNIFQHPRF